MKSIHWLQVAHDLAFTIIALVAVGLVFPLLSIPQPPLWIFAVTLVLDLLWTICEVQWEAYKEKKRSPKRRK